MDKDETDALDKRILDIIQSDFPLVSRPYEEIARRLDSTEKEVFDRVRKMRESGLVRRIGANYQSSRLGFVSTLCAAKAPPDKLEEFIAFVNAIPGVTHNYEREHDYNIWFTLISPSRERTAEILAEIEAKTGVRPLNLPATRLFKIKVDFPMED
ncbi:MAG: Lrp/AsnC family transcriptional regulator [Desulfovibrio sp.]|nr:Lrp/AsnC family transcriptional regulator [Desulfovibrio sp.]